MEQLKREILNKLKDVDSFNMEWETNQDFIFEFGNAIEGNGEMGINDSLGYSMYLYVSLKDKERANAIEFYETMGNKILQELERIFTKSFKWNFDWKEIQLNFEFLFQNDSYWIEWEIKHSKIDQLNDLCRNNPDLKERLIARINETLENNYSFDSLIHGIEEEMEEEEEKEDKEEMEIIWDIATSSNDIANLKCYLESF